MNLGKITLLVLVCWILQTGVAFCDLVASPVELLGRTWFSKDYQCKNSARVYEDISNLCTQPDLIMSEFFREYPETRRRRIAIAWSGDAKVAGEEWTLTIKKGTTVMQALEMIAKRRGDFIFKRDNFLCMTRKEIKANAVYNEDGRAAYEVVGFIMAPHPVAIIGSDADAIQDFINHKLKETQKAIPSRKLMLMTIDKGAKAKIKDFSLVGEWFYSDFLDAMCMATTTRWKIAGDQVAVYDPK